MKSFSLVEVLLALLVISLLLSGSLFFLKTPPEVSLKYPLRLDAHQLISGMQKDYYENDIEPTNTSGVLTLQPVPGLYASGECTISNQIWGGLYAGSGFGVGSSAYNGVLAARTIVSDLK